MSGLQKEKEISSLPSIDSVSLFLNNSSINYYLIKALLIKNDIQNYLTFLLQDVIQELTKYPNIILSLELPKDDNLSSVIEQYEHITYPTDKDRFYSKYISTLLKTDILKEKEQHKDEKIIQYYDKLLQILEGSNNEKLLSFSLFMEYIYQRKNENELTTIYQIQYMLIIQWIDRLIDKIKLTLDKMPLCIKYIAKIISEQIKKKFPECTHSDIHKYISKFFVDILIGNIISNPLYNNILTPQNYTTNIQINIRLIFQYFTLMIQEIVFIEEKDNHLKAFNQYFFEKMPDIYYIFDKLIDVELPELTQKEDNKKGALIQAILITPKVQWILLSEINYYFDCKIFVL